MAVTTRVADILLLVASVWVAILLARASRDAWRGIAQDARLAPVEA